SRQHLRRIEAGGLPRGRQPASIAMAASMIGAAESANGSRGCTPDVPGASRAAFLLHPHSDCERLPAGRPVGCQPGHLRSRALLRGAERMEFNGLPSVITLQDLTKVFSTEEVETHALSNVSIQIQRGEYVSIAGPSGCGKSTLLSILGLLDSPTQGSY